jgi:hypothetical protein
VYTLSGGAAIFCIAGKFLYFSGSYIGNGGTGDDFGGGGPNEAWLLIVLSDGRGARKLAVEVLGAYIPKPYAFSGLVGYNLYRMSSSGSAMV